MLGAAEVYGRRGGAAGGRASATRKQDSGHRPCRELGLGSPPGLGREGSHSGDTCALGATKPGLNRTREAGRGE